LPSLPYSPASTATPISSVLRPFSDVSGRSSQPGEMHKPSEIKRLGTLFFAFGCELFNAKIS
jgi:hypothetical protein